MLCIGQGPVFIFYFFLQAQFYYSWQVYLPLVASPTKIKDYISELIKHYDQDLPRNTTPKEASYISWQRFAFPSFWKKQKIKLSLE